MTNAKKAARLIVFGAPNNMGRIIYADDSHSYPFATIDEGHQSLNDSHDAGKISEEELDRLSKALDSSALVYKSALPRTVWFVGECNLEPTPESGPPPNH